MAHSLVRFNARTGRADHGQISDSDLSCTQLKLSVVSVMSISHSIVQARACNASHPVWEVIDHVKNTYKLHTLDYIAETLQDSYTIEMFEGVARSEICLSAKKKLQRAWHSISSGTFFLGQVQCERRAKPKWSNGTGENLCCRDSSGWFWDRLRADSWSKMSSTVPLRRLLVIPGHSRPFRLGVAIYPIFWLCKYQWQNCSDLCRLLRHHV